MQTSSGRASRATVPHPALFPYAARLWGMSLSAWAMLPTRTFWIMLDKLCRSGNLVYLACPVRVPLRGVSGQAL